MKVAAQMYSVRGYVKDNGYGAALQELAKIGFKSVEHACGFGEFDGKPAELRKFLDGLGMTMMGTHLGAEAIFDEEQRKKTTEFYATLGAKYLICPWDDRFYDYDSQPAFIEQMNIAAEYLKPFGMGCGFHCHTNEFFINPKTGKTYWETFAENTVDNVVLEQDCGWSTIASQDAAALIRKYPGRSQALHFKPSVRPSQRDRKAILGQDSVPWGDVVKAAREVGGTEFVVIEQEWYPDGKTDMESIAQSFDGLKQWL